VEQWFHKVPRVQSGVLAEDVVRKPEEAPVPDTAVELQSVAFRTFPAAVAALQTEEVVAVAVVLVDKPGSMDTSVVSAGLAASWAGLPAPLHLVSSAAIPLLLLVAAVHSVDCCFAGSAARG